MIQDVNDVLCKVVYNDEEQYSIWLDDAPIPDGWYAEGYEGTRDTCLAYLDIIWTDLRKVSLREHMKKVEGEQQVQRVAASLASGIPAAGPWTMAS